MALKSDAIKKWMSIKGVDDLKTRYHKGMEVQVNVIPGKERITKEYKGRNYDRFTDGLIEWGPFRIPLAAKGDPVDNDSELRWPFEKYLQAIGMTGWNWQDKHSEYVGFDFDSIINHSQGLKKEDINEVIDRALALEYVTVRRSTSGSGFHLEVHLDNVPTANHTEHAALARAILGKMCADTGYNFQEKVDCYGGVLWIWAIKQLGTTGLELIKKGELLIDLPTNWRDHIPVISGSRKRIRPEFVESAEKEDRFLALLQDKPMIRVGKDHQALIAWLADNNCQAWWDADHSMLVCHTHDLKRAHTSMSLMGVFETISQGTEAGVDKNAFAFPLPNGGWSIRRYSRGVEEHELWTQDGRGWTKCYFNVPADLESASKSVGGVEDERSRFNFNEAELAAEAARLLGASMEIPQVAVTRSAVLSRTKEGKLVSKIERSARDMPTDFNGWMMADKGKTWQRIYNVPAERPMEPEVESHDDMIRHLVSEQSMADMGWVIRTQDTWIEEPKQNCMDALTAQGIPANKLKLVLGNCIKSPFYIVNKPFDDEYLGNRRWNRKAAQLKYKPRKEYKPGSLIFPTWAAILSHCGSGLNTAIKEDEWCKAVGILTGSDYLKCWVASMFQTPAEPLPYLFFHGPENSGKSSFHESLQMLMTGGYARADQALVNDSGYNAELQNAVLCVVEEINLAMDKRASSRIKDWVTGMGLAIHEKRMTPILVENCTHWVQMSNDINSCPVNFGDTRITFCYVGPLENMIPRRELHAKLIKEAPDFITELMNVEVPRPDDRLGLKVLNTEDKEIVSELMESPVARFIRKDVFDSPGYVVSCAILYLKFKELYPEAKDTKHQFSTQIPLNKFPKGRIRGGKGLGEPGTWAYGNMSIKEMSETRPSLAKEGEYLE